MINEMLFYAAGWSWWSIFLPPSLIILLVILLYESSRRKGTLSAIKKIATGVVIVVSFYTMAWAADTKLSALTADATPGTDSLLYTIDDPAGTPVSRKSTIAQVLGASANIDPADGSIEWEDAAALEADGSLSVNAVDSDQYVDGSIDNVHVATGLDAAKLGDGTVSNTEYQQVGTIGATTITAAQWGYVGGADQPVKTTDTPTFAGAKLYDGNSNYSTLAAGDSVADLTWTFPTAYPAGNDYLLQVSTAGAVSTTNSLSSVTFGGFTASMAVQSDASGNLESSSTISSTELGYLNGLSEAISTSLAAKEGTLTNSAGLAAALSDESGSGAALFAGGDIGAATATTPAANDNDTSVATSAYVQTELTAYNSDSVTLTNKTIDADGTGNSLSNIDEGNMKSGSDIVTDAICFMIDGGGSAITTGVKGYFEVPYSATIKQVTMIADQSGSIVVDIWKDTYANALPTDADSITASAVPTITTAVKSQDSTLTGWTTAITAGDIFGYNVDSITTVTLATICLKVEK